MSSEKNKDGLTIEGFTIMPREYLVISKDKNGKILDLTTELPGPPLSLTKNLYVKGGSDRCHLCGFPYNEEIFHSLTNLMDNKELEVKCVACATTHIYFRKGIPFDFEKVRKFLEKYLKP